MANTAKTVEVYFENVLDTIEDQDMMVDMVDFFEPDGAEMQNSGNVVWRPAEQQSAILEGWDLSGQEQTIIQEAYPATLETPKNTLIQQRADDLRDTQFWERQGMRDGRQQAVNLNSAIANAIATQGSQYYRQDLSSSNSGYDFIAEAQARLNEEQRAMSDRYFILNDRDNLAFAKDLAARQTVQGKPNAVWESGQIGNNIAQFDVYTGSFLPTLAGGASPDTTVSGAQSFAPEPGVIASDYTVTNNDYRLADIPVADSSAYNVGDKITFTNDPAGTPEDVLAVGYSDKTVTTRAKTFTVVAKPDGTTLSIFPKPIAADDSALTDLEKAYANVNTTIADGAQVNRLNTDASNRTNLFFDRSAIEVLGGNIPANLMQEFDGKRVITETLSNGLQLYMVYDGNIEDMTFRYRCFTWWGVTVKDPQRCGAAVTF